MSRRLLAALLVAAAAAAAVALNVLLLGSASAKNEPVGQLSPRAHLPAAPQWTVRPTDARSRADNGSDGADD
jgi:hypothetical protein